MSSNPFDEPEADRTIIVPRPGGSRRGAPPVPPVQPVAAPTAMAAPTAFPATARPPAELPEAGPTASLVGVCATLIDLAVRLRRTANYPNPVELRDRVVSQARRLEERLGTTGLPANLVRAAHYAVCATVDDIVLNTPWGSTSVWMHHSLVSTFHNEATGGERFFALLDNARRNPAGHLQLLELMHVCLSIGFAGRFRLRPQGANELAAIRDELYRTICQQHPSMERDLSPSWRGMGGGHKPLHSVVPAWVSGAGAAVLILAVYFGFNLKLNDYSDQAFTFLAKLPPGAAVVTRVAAVAQQAPAAPSKVRSFLEPEIREGLVSVTETASDITVSIRAQGMFDSGSATVRPQLLAVLDRIGKALVDEPGDVMVAGHTDNVPIRSGRFPSNWHLSMARAQAVEGVLAAGASRQINAQGYADTRPIADNATPEGRELNRRIEVILKKKLPTSTGL